jgi:hypothetical protein
VATATTEAPVAADTSTVAANGGDPDPAVGSTDACRADPACPSSEHRTGDLCGATLIVDTAGYLEGRHDAEQGLPYGIDGAPAPSPERTTMTTTPPLVRRPHAAPATCRAGATAGASSRSRTEPGKRGGS